MFINDESILIDFTTPKSIRNTMSRLEKIELKSVGLNDYDLELLELEYDALLDFLVTAAKSALGFKDIDQRQYDLILKRYGGIS